MKSRLLLLEQSFSYFVFADAYETFLSLLKSYLKYFKKQKSTQTKPSSSTSKMELVNYFLIPEIEFMLRKFFIAIDIHAYLKMGSISGAVNSILEFIKAFESKLSIEEKVTHLQNAAYLSMVATFGKIYCPDYALKLVDADFNTFQYYDKN